MLQQDPRSPNHLTMPACCPSPLRHVPRPVSTADCKAATASQGQAARAPPHTPTHLEAAGAALPVHVHGPRLGRVAHVALVAPRPAAAVGSTRGQGVSTEHADCQAAPLSPQQQGTRSPVQQQQQQQPPPQTAACRAPPSGMPLRPPAQTHLVFPQLVHAQSSSVNFPGGPPCGAARTGGARPAGARRGEGPWCSARLMVQHGAPLRAAGQQQGGGAGAHAAAGSHPRQGVARCCAPPSHRRLRLQVVRPRGKVGRQ
jgi:hypothetical protein